MSRRLLLLMIALIVCFGAVYLLLTRVSDEPSEQWPDLAAEAINAGDLSAAREILLDARRSDPEDHEVLVTLAIVDGLAGEYERALQWIDEHPRASDDPRLTFYAGRYSLNLNDLQPSMVNLNRTLQLQPNHLEARRLLADLEATLLRPNEARRHLAALDTYGAVGALEVCQFCAGDRSRYDAYQNVTHLERMLERDPSNPLLIYALADNYFRLDRSSDAHDLLSAVGDSWQTLPQEGSWRIPLGLAELLVDEGNFDAALLWLNDLPEQANGSYRVWLARGRCYRALDQARAAVVSFRNAATLDPYNPEPVFVMSRLLSEDDPDEAGRLRQRAERLQSLNVLMESTLKVDSLESAAERILEIAEKLAELGLEREAVLCFRWLQDMGYSFNQIDTRLNELEGRTLNQSLAFSLPDPAQLTDLPPASTGPQE